MTVKAEIANIMGGIICPNNHLSIKGSKYQGKMILFIFFLLVIDLKVSKEIYFFTDFFNIIKY